MLSTLFKTDLKDYDLCWARSRTADSPEFLGEVKYVRKNHEETQPLVGALLDATAAALDARERGARGLAAVVLCGARRWRTWNAIEAGRWRIEWPWNATDGERGLSILSGHRIRLARRGSAERVNSWTLRRFGRVGDLHVVVDVSIHECGANLLFMFERRELILTPELAAAA